MKKLFLHIGSHKTGTSSLQSALQTQARQLNEVGFGYFDANPDGSVAVNGNTSKWIPVVADKSGLVPSGIVAQVDNPDRLTAMLDATGFDNVIMSAENFSWIFSIEEIRSLQRALSTKFSVHIIVYIRRQDRQIVSHFQQSSKGRTLPSAMYFGDGCRALPSEEKKFDDYLDYNTRLSMWADVFGDSYTSIRVFDDQRLIGGDIITDFLQTIGLEGISLKTVRRNETNGFERTKVGHLINQVNIPRTIADRIRRCANNTGKLLPTRAEAEAIYWRYAQSNKALNIRFNLSPTNVAIFKEDFSTYPEQVTDIWTEETANEAILSIFASLKDLNTLDPTVLRDAAIALESIDMKLSLKLMLMAKTLNPKGEFIRRKLASYRQLLSS